MLSRDSNLVSPKEAAQVLGVTDQFLYRKAAEGTLPHYRIGRSVKFDLKELAQCFRREGSDAVRQS